MNARDVRSHCYEQLKQELTTRGFTGNKKERQFVRANAQGFDQVFFGVVEYAALKEYVILFSIGVRVDRVQELVNQTIRFHVPEQAAKALTCLVDIGRFIGHDELRFSTFSLDDIDAAVSRFLEIYDQHVETFFKNAYDIAFLNSLFPRLQNKVKYWLTPTKWYVTVPTVAWLADAATFPQFRKDYTAYMHELDIPQDKLDKLNTYLDSITKTNS